MSQKLAARKNNVRVASLPCGFSGAATVSVTLGNTTILLANRGKSASFPALVHGSADPVDAGVSADLGTTGMNMVRKRVYDGGECFENLK